MGPIQTSHHTTSVQVTTSPSRLYGILVSVSEAAASSIILKDGGSGGAILFTAKLGDASLGPLYIPLPAETYIRFSEKIYLAISGSVSDVTLFYQV